MNPQFNKKRTEQMHSHTPVQRGVRPQTQPRFVPRPDAKVSGKGKLRIIPLGGLEEVGENMTAMEYEDSIIVIEMGFGFPDASMPGVDYVIPDFRYLQQNKEKIKGVLITHGHLDHIGGIPYILPRIGDPPIYTMRLTAAMIQQRLEEFNLLKRSTVREVNPDDVLQLGKFSVEFVRLNHNIPDSVGLAIHTPVGTVVYVTDWKFDMTPVGQKPADIAKLARIGGEGVRLMMGDSTNVEKSGYTPSEHLIEQNLNDILEKAHGRIIFTTFSSLITRIQQLFNFANKHNKKIVVIGRSIVKAVELCLKLKYLTVLPKTLITIDQARKLPDDKVIILTTGSQGEEFAALSRISRGEHKKIRIKNGDTVVVSASQIPGNEDSVTAVLDNLSRQGANVIYNKTFDVHSSGHAHQEELKFMIGLNKPEYFMPIHGEHFMLVQHAKIAQNMGIAKDHTFLLDNGEVLELDAKGARKVPSDVPSGYILVDGLGVGDVSHVVLRDRKVMAEEGMFVVIVTVDHRTGKLTVDPDIISRGFIYMKDNIDVIKEAKHEVRKIVETTKVKGEANTAFIKSEIRDRIGEYILQKTNRRPLVVPVVLEA